MLRCMGKGTYLRRYHDPEFRAFWVNLGCLGRELGAKSSNAVSGPGGVDAPSTQLLGDSPLRVSWITNNLVYEKRIDLLDETARPGRLISPFGGLGHGPNNG